MIEAISLIIFAAVFQGVFLLPMSRARGWAWEHIWLAFSATGMIACNWVLTFLLLPNPAAIFAGVPHHELLTLACFGIAWGVGAVLFGLAMDMLGLALGYPLIMGLNASVGTLVPLLWTYGTAMFSGRRLFIGVGTVIAIAGISICSIAAARRESGKHQIDSRAAGRTFSGLAVAIASGLLSSLPNIGLYYGTASVESARRLGASSTLAGNAVWFIFFTFGGAVNVLYCWWLMIRHKNTHALFAPARVANWLPALAMGGMWIGSFYLYGIGTAELGQDGSTIGWPIFVTLSIGVGVFGGLSRGEWKGANPKARTLLWLGLFLIVAAVLLIPLGGT